MTNPPSSTGTISQSAFVSLFPSYAGAGGNNLYVGALDFASGQPITQGVCVSISADALPQPKSWTGALECNPSGQTVSTSGLTDKNGVYSWSIPGTCPWAIHMLIGSPGYQDQNPTLDTGTISGPIFFVLVLQKGTMGSLGGGGACQGAWADLNYTGTTTSNTTSQIIGNAWSSFAGTGTTVLIILAVIVVAVVIALVVLKPSIQSVNAGGAPKP